MFHSWCLYYSNCYCHTDCCNLFTCLFIFVCNIHLHCYVIYSDTNNFVMDIWQQMVMNLRVISNQNE